MAHEISTARMIERAILVGTILPGQPKQSAQANLQELFLLAKTAGATVITTILQNRIKLDPAYYIGRGKVHEIRELLQKEKGNLVIFDDELSAGQVRNLEKVFQAKVIDRTDLILDIFAWHARTKEAKVQVELAQLQYLLPRLSGAWKHWEQQTGGIGTRGPGETQLETDHRTVNKKISVLRERLRDVEKNQFERRKGRIGIRQVCLVGYTNAGKSTLLNRLVREKAKVADQLFSTLDTITRRLYLGGAGIVLLSDTVGFIRKLPTHLVESFNSTLDVVRQADLLLHVVDASNSEYEKHIETVQETLQKLEVSHTPQILIFNKIDQLQESSNLLRIQRHFEAAQFVSAQNGNGILELKESLSAFFGKQQILTV